MASANFSLMCGLKVRMGCQDRLCINSDADETIAKWESRYVSEVLPQSCRKFMLEIYYVASSIIEVTIV